jgi:hypothetical protein
VFVKSKSYGRRSRKEAVDRRFCESAAARTSISKKKT